MISPATMLAFSREVQKEGAILQPALEGVYETGRLLKTMATQPGRALREGWEGLANVSPAARREMAEGLKGKGPRYAADFYDAPGWAAEARRGGLLANVPKYVGQAPAGPASLADLGRYSAEAAEHYGRKGVNVLGRALPGQKAVQVPLLTLGTGSTLAQKTDPRTGRQLGLAERAGAAAGGLATGLASSRAGFIAGTLGQEIGTRAGRWAGRATDVGAGQVRRLVQE